MGEIFNGVKGHENTSFIRLDICEKISLLRFLSNSNDRSFGNFEAEKQGRVWKNSHALRY